MKTNVEADELISILRAKILSSIFEGKLEIPTHFHINIEALKIMMKSYRYQWMFQEIYLERTMDDGTIESKSLNNKFFGLIPIVNSLNYLNIEPVQVLDSK